MKVTWGQVFAWRLRRQYLDPRGEVSSDEVVNRLCGVQSQVASAAEMAVRIRQRTPDTDGVKRGLAGNSLVKTWAMRGTLHLMGSSDIASYLALLASSRTWEKPVWQRSFGASPKEVAELTEAVSTVLDGTVLTRDELVTKIVGDKRFAHMEGHLRSGWGALLKPLAWQGALCHGPNQGNKTTFARPADLIPDWRGLPEPDEAAPVAIAAYLGAYGPATPEVFDAWLSRNSMPKAPLRKWFADMGEALTEVDLEGRTAYVLTEHADELAGCEPTDSVRLVGAFDQYVLGPGTKLAQMLPPQHRSKVSRTAGWISPVVVAGGRIVGVWELTDHEIVVSPFPDEAQPSREALEAEAAQVAQAGGSGALRLRMA